MRTAAAVAPVLVVTLAVAVALQPRATGASPTISITQPPTVIAATHYRFSVNGTTSGGTWTASAGTITNAGDYTAPATGGGTATVTYTDANNASASATFAVGALQVAGLTSNVTAGGMPAPMLHSPNFWHHRVAAAPDGRGYLAYPVQFQGAANKYGVVVLSTRDGGDHWGNAQIVSSPHSQNPISEITLAIDAGDSRTLYLAYNGDQSFFSSSTDGGTTFMTPKAFSKSVSTVDMISHAGGSVFLCIPEGFNPDLIDFAITDATGTGLPDVQHPPTTNPFTPPDFRAPAPNSNLAIDVVRNQNVTSPRLAHGGGVTGLAFQGTLRGPPGVDPPPPLPASNLMCAYFTCTKPGADPLHLSKIAHLVFAPAPPVAPATEYDRVADSAQTSPPVMAIHATSCAVALGVTTPPSAGSKTSVYLSHGKITGEGVTQAVIVSKSSIPSYGTITKADQPDLTYDAGGNLWLAYRVSANSLPTAIAVQKSTDDGATWSDAVVVTPATPNDANQDCPRLLVFGRKVSVISRRQAGHSFYDIYSLVR